MKLLGASTSKLFFLEGPLSKLLYQVLLAVYNFQAPPFLIESNDHNLYKIQTSFGGKSCVIKTS